MKRLMLMISALLTVVLLGQGVAAAGLPVATDLRSDAQLAQKARLPLLVFFSAQSCHYCEVVRSLYLGPMYTSGDYAGKVIMREVQVESGRSLRDFKGDKISQVDFARRYSVSLTPQIMFMDPDGKQLVPAMVGLSTPDFFGGYLDESIDAALASLRAIHP